MKRKYFVNCFIYKSRYVRLYNSKVAYMYLSIKLDTILKNIILKIRAS